MKVGFTGTGKGMNSKQLVRLKLVLSQIGVREFHHGDCIGSDKQASFLVKAMGAKIHLHPPSNPGKRAFCDADVTYVPKSYLVRNRDIVNATYVLVATPRTMGEELRSGTWATIRYARKQSRRIYIVWPDGTVSEEN